MGGRRKRDIYSHESWNSLHGQRFTLLEHRGQRSRKNFSAKKPEERWLCVPAKMNYSANVLDNGIHNGALVDEDRQKPRLANVAARLPIPGTTAAARR